MINLISSLNMVLIASALVAQRPQGNAVTQSAADEPAGNYGKIPMSFEVNEGQADPAVQFLAHGQGYALFLRHGEAVLALRSAGTRGTGSGMPASPHDGPPVKADAIETSLIRMRFVGANAQTTVHPEDGQITRSNYFIGNDPAGWRRDVPNFGRIRYADIYPGVDLVYYGNQRQLEHDFVIAPGGDPGRIIFALKGAKRLRIDSRSGDLIVSKISSDGASELHLLKPITYQDVHGRRTQVRSSYKLLGGNRIGFTVSRYDLARPLVIDPVLVYSTYLGGSPKFPNGYGDQGNGIAVDNLGNAYVVGTTLSMDFPVTSGAFQDVNHTPAGLNASTVLVTKLNASGTRWCIPLTWEAQAPLQASAATSGTGLRLILRATRT
jgi:hypothetical protein